MKDLTLEERIKRIEDELGLTEIDNRKHKRDKLVAVYKSYGYTNILAKAFAHSNLKDGISAEEAEKKLIKRGAVKPEEA